MIFSTLTFLLFFSICYGAYWCCSSRQLRHGLLLVLSFVFYGWWDWRFLALIGFVILVSWATPLLYKRAPSHRRMIFITGISLILVQLGVFKYYNFFVSSLQGVLNLAGIQAHVSSLQIILPVGISFFSFQAISYLVDAIKGRSPISNLKDVALYIAFFPQLVAGPIVRSEDFLPQLKEDKRNGADVLFSGMIIFLRGFIYKTVFADTIAPFVDTVYAQPELFSPDARVFATIGFYAQIYFDFAGYSAMAIGIAKMLGFDLPDNFRFPYISRSLIEFWRRWHISLSSWLRDYLYIPLGGNLKGPLFRYKNIMVTMLLGGLWHGASWAFVIWGGFHGLGLLINHAFRNRCAALKKAYRAPVFILQGIVFWGLTQLVVLLCWIPFRADNLDHVWSILQGFVGMGGSYPAEAVDIPYVLILLPLFIDHLFLSGIVRIRNKPQLPYWATAAILGMIFSVALSLLQLKVQPFIYFQF